MIESDYYKMYFASAIFTSHDGLTLKYISKTFKRFGNDFSMCDITSDGITHHYGTGDDFMDLTERLGLKIIGVDML